MEVEPIKFKSVELSREDIERLPTVEESFIPLPKHATASCTIPLTDEEAETFLDAIADPEWPNVIE